jgi:hypothetical protein
MTLLFDSYGTRRVFFRLGIALLRHCPPPFFSTGVLMCVRVEGGWFSLIMPRDCSFGVRL